MYETMEDLACQFHIVLNILWPWSSLASFKSTLSIYDLSVNVEQETYAFSIYKCTNKIHYTMYEWII
jgi:hypothetical protein